MELRLALSSLTAIVAACQAPPAPSVLNDDGGWCWFQDERALALGDVVVFGSIASGRVDETRRGDVEVTLWWPATGRTRRVELHDRLELDDHDAPALLELAGGRLLAVYARHGSDHLVRWRRTEDRRDLASWEPERTFAASADDELGITYSNVFDTGDEVLDFFRGRGWDPGLIVSTDAGESWTDRGRLLGGPGRPYVKYAGSGDAVHFIATEQHPRDFDNGLYHGFYRDGVVHDSSGRPVGAVGDDPPAPDELTRVFPGAPDAVAWPVDLEVDAAGHPVAVFSIQTDGAGLPPGSGGLAHLYQYARFDGSSWQVEPLAHAGRRLYPGEDDYTGLAAIDPADPSVVYLSTDADPRTGEPLISRADGRRHRELYRARRVGSAEPGDRWSFEPITLDSTADNLRPIVPRGSPRVLLWLRGTLASYTDYALEVVGLPLE